MFELQSRVPIVLSILPLRRSLPSSIMVCWVPVPAEEPDSRDVRGDVCVLAFNIGAGPVCVLPVFCVWSAVSHASIDHERCTVRPVPVVWSW